MKIGSTLQELAVELDRQKGAKRDFVADTRNLRIGVTELGDRREVLLDVNPIGGTQQRFPLNGNAHAQIGDRIKLPKKYYDRMLEEAPELLARNVNHWFQKEPEQRMVRTLDGTARAFLSNRYRIMDHYDFLQVILAELSNCEQKVEIPSCQVTERRLYLKVRLPWITSRIDIRPGVGHDMNLRDGDLVESCITFSNSEIGGGGLQVQPGVFTHRCTNLVIAKEVAMRKLHLGPQQGDSEEAQEIFSDETRKKSDEALWLKVRDTTRAAMDPKWFAGIVKKMQSAARNEIPKAVNTVELISERFALSSDEHASVLEHLISGGDLSQYGLMSAVTRTAQDVESYDRATELEQLGGDVLAMPDAAWKELVLN